MRDAMKSVSATEFQENYDAFRAVAATEPITIVMDNGETIVILSMSEYQRLKQYDTQQAPSP